MASTAPRAPVLHSVAPTPTPARARDERLRAPRIRLSGARIDMITESQAVHEVIRQAAAGRGGRLLTIDLHGLREFARDRSVRALYESAELVVADGMPLVWASRIQRTPLPMSVASPSLLLALSAAAARSRISVFLLGDYRGTAGVADRLRRSGAGLQIAGVHRSPGRHSDGAASIKRIEAWLDETLPDIVYLALPGRAALTLSHRLAPRFPRTWFVAVGASRGRTPDEVRPAPMILRTAGLEWAHRLTQEARRPFGRCALRDLPFAGRLALRSLATRQAGR